MTYGIGDEKHNRPGANVLQYESVDTFRVKYKFIFNICLDTKL